MKTLKRKWMVIFSLLTVLFLITACSSQGEESSEEVKEENGEVTVLDPKKNVDMLVGFSAGGGTDIIARTAAKIMKDEGIVENSFVVENVPGASGSFAMDRALQREGDPHVLISTPDFAAPIWDGTMEADLSDFTLISQLATDSIIITVNSDSPYKSIEDLFEAIKENPGSINIGIGEGIVSTEGYSWYKIAEALGVDYLDLNIIPFDGGAEITTALLGGHIDVVAINPSSIMGHVESEDLRPLASQSAERSEILPEVPTLKESGIDYVYYRPRAMWGAGNLTDEEVKYWEDAFEELTKSDVWIKEYIEPNMLENNYSSSKEYGAFVEEKINEFVKFSEEYSEYVD